MIKVKKIIGISLIEILIAIGIMAIIGAIGYPQYKNSQMIARRGLAHAELLKAEWLVEKFLTENGRSNESFAASDITSYFPNYAAAAGTPVLSSGNFYRIIISDTSLSGTGYNITAYATVTGNTADCTNASYSNRLQCPDTRCRQIIIDNGLKISRDSGNTLATATTTQCW